jgi:hypothetical protein
MLCNFETNCDGMNYAGVRSPTFCIFHKDLHNQLGYEDKVFVFHEERQMRLKLYENNPILKYLRNLKNKEQLQEILFCFGEITEDDESYFYHNRKNVKKAFQIVCPNMIVENYYMRWKNGEMNPIVFDKLIFPDFLFIDKNELIY